MAWYTCSSLSSFPDSSLTHTKLYNYFSSLLPLFWESEFLGLRLIVSHWWLVNQSFQSDTFYPTLQIVPDHSSPSFIKHDTGFARALFQNMPTACSRLHYHIRLQQSKFLRLWLIASHWLIGDLFTNSSSGGPTITQSVMPLAYLGAHATNYLQFYIWLPYVYDWTAYPALPDYFWT